MKKYLLPLLMILFSGAVLAAPYVAPDSSTNIQGWMPGPEDKTVQAFAYIFGDVYGLFSSAGVEETVAGAIFRLFNSAVLMIGMVLVGYTIIAGTLKTAHEGSVLGQKWSSMWIPLRSSFGIAMTMPAVGGYSLVQAMVMGVALLGVGFANAAWNVALNFSANGGTMNAEGALQIKPATMPMTTNILKSLTCMAAINKFDNEGGRKPLTLTMKQEYPLTEGGEKSDYPYTIMAFGENSECGDLRFLNTSVAKKSMVGNPLYSNRTDAEYAQEVASMQQAHQQASMALIAALQPAALAIVNGDQVNPDYISQVATAYGLNVGTAAKKAFAQNSRRAYEAFLNENARDGWILAGAYYFKLAHMNDVATKALKSLPSYTKPALSSESVAVQNQVAPFLIAASAATGVAKAGGNSGSQLMISDAASTMTDGNGDNVSGILSSIFGNLFPDLASLVMSYMYSDDNPLIVIKNIGDALLDTAEALAVAAMLASAAWPAFMAAISVVLGFVMIGMFSAAIIMSLWTPMLPYIIWIMAVVGYMVIVVQSMIAAPLWAIMHASPEGHEMSGQGANGYMILLSLLLRPILMVLGLVFSMILMIAGLKLLMYTFKPAMDMVSAGTGTFIVTFLAIIVIFDLIVLKIVHRCLELINELPHEIMQWIGGSAHVFGDEGIKDGGHHIIGGAVANLRGGLAAGKGKLDADKAKAAADAAKSRNVTSDSENAKHINPD